MYYKLSSDQENFRNYFLPEEYNFEYSQSFDGRSHVDSYKPITFVMTKKSEKKYPIADIMCGFVPVCSERAKNVISDICKEGEVEFLPCNLEGSNDQYYIFNILGTEDCVDYEKSKFTRFQSSGRIMSFDHIEFNRNVDRNFFRISDLKNNFYFVSEEAKNKLEQAGLLGVRISDKLFKN